MSHFPHPFFGSVTEDSLEKEERERERSIGAVPEGRPLSSLLVACAGCGEIREREVSSFAATT